MSFRQFLQLLDFAVSKQGGGIDDGADLKHLGDNRCARRWQPVRKARETIRRQRVDAEPLPRSKPARMAFSGCCSSEIVGS